MAALPTSAAKPSTEQRIAMTDDDWHPAKAFVEHVLSDMAPKVESSAFFLSLCPRDGGEGDVKFWVELGCAVMLDKPILSVVPYAEHDKLRISRKLRILSDEIVYAPDGMNDQVSADIQIALGRMKQRLRT